MTPASVHPQQWGRTAAWLALFLCLAPAAQAQFKLFVVNGSTETAVPPVYDLGSFYSGESATVRFRLRNTSSAPATVGVLTVAGVGFTVTGPTPPVGLAPGEALNLSVIFGATDTGTYSAALNTEGVSVLLTASIAPRLTYRVDPPSATPFPGPLDFGALVRGTPAQRRILIANQTGQAMIVPAIAVQGNGFALQGTAPTGQALAPGQGSEFTIAFTPPAPGTFTGSLTLGDRTYALTGTGIDPPLPKPIVSVNLPQRSSAQQGTLVVQFDAPAQTSGTGTATIDWQGPADPAIVFASGARTATFAIAPGDVQAALPFQTGTTAGVLTFTAQIGDATDRGNVAIGAAAPSISAAQGIRSATGVEVRVTAWDNTRTMGSVAFTFFDAAGNTIAPGKIYANAGDDFGKYFATSGLGGVFQLRAVFPVTGDPAAVASCEAVLANSTGTATTPRTTF